MKKSRAYRKTRYIIYRQTILDPIDHLWTFLGGFTGIGIIGYLQSLQFSQLDNVFLIGSFGASAVLVYGATNSPLAQPRNLMGGHLLSALIGVTVASLLPDPELNWLACALAASLSMVAMQITKTMHPPGGATALIAVMGSEKIKSLGYMYILSPVLTGALILLVTALIFNNLSHHRTYPYR
ncbi:MAG: HPP family protein [Sediminicola sp.]